MFVKLFHREDHPLNCSPASQWQSFFRDNEVLLLYSCLPYSRHSTGVQVLLQIDKDVRRLCPDLTFFQQPSPHPNTQVGRARLQFLPHRTVQPGGGRAGRGRAGTGEAPRQGQPGSAGVSGDASSQL